MNDTEQKLNSLKKQLESIVQEEYKLRDEIDKLTTALENNVKVGDCFEYNSTFIRIVEIDGRYVNYMTVFTDIEHEDVSFDTGHSVTIDFLLSTYTRISKEYFVEKLNECVKAALELGTNINTK